MSKPLLSREELVAKLVDVIFDVGYDGATLSVISAATGLGKASLYHHFPGGKQQMAAEVLAHSDRWGAEHIGQLLRSQATAESKVRGIFRALDEVHHRTQQLTLMNVFTYGAARPVFGPQVAERVRNGMAVLARLLRECGVAPAEADARALSAYIEIEGAMVLTRTLDDMSIFRNVIRRLPDQLLRGASTPAPQDDPAAPLESPSEPDALAAR